MATINCRAKVSQACTDGKSWPHPEDSGPWEDGTYESSDGSIVCDPCYVFLMPYSPSGKLLLHEIPYAIYRAREELRV